MTIDNITFDELVQYIELKKKMNMCTGRSMDEYTVVEDLKDILKIGDVTVPYEDYYVIVDVQVNKEFKATVFGLSVKPHGDTFVLSDGGATYFNSRSSYIEKKLEIDVTQLKDYHFNKEKREEIEKLEKRLEELKSELI